MLRHQEPPGETTPEIPYLAPARSAQTMPSVDNPIIVQSDRSILVETVAPRYPEARDALVRFAELVKSPEHIHTYRITPLSLWNAAASGLDSDYVINSLKDLTKYALPENVLTDIADYMNRYGRLKLAKDENGVLTLHADSPMLMTQVLHHKTIKPHILHALDEQSAIVHEGARGEWTDREGAIKQALLKVGLPVEDLAGYVDGAPLPVAMRETTLEGLPFNLRSYQDEAVKSFYVDGSARGGSGTIVLPCGAGKTAVGMAVMSRVKQNTLILCTNITALHQWRDELLDKSDLDPEIIGEYSGEKKEVKPVTLATYQILISRRRKDEQFIHFDIFDQGNWGLIIYDEVHLLPAPVFRATAEVQARRRLGLTATLVREDGLEGDVFSLIGPKRFDIPWRELEQQGWIATASCQEIRVPFPDDNIRLEYAVAAQRDRYRQAADNPAKLAVLKELVKRHKNDRVLIIGQYIDQLEKVARRFKAPLITGSTPNKEREIIYERFRTGEETLLVVSKVANFAIDLPDANVAIQISGTFGSRQEEAQRLGRVLRPKKGENTAKFYSIVTHDSIEQEFSARRQLFLAEQGYKYEIVLVDPIKK